jgi:hypothetical protein
MEHLQKKTSHQIYQSKFMIKKRLVQTYLVDFSTFFIDFEENFNNITFYIHNNPDNKNLKEYDIIEFYNKLKNKSNLNSLSISIVLLTLLKKQLYDSVIPTFQYYLDLGMVNHYHFTIVIQYFRDIEDHENLIHYFNEMIQLNIKPSFITFKIIIKYLIYNTTDKLKEIKIYTEYLFSYLTLEEINDPKFAFALVNHFIINDDLLYSYDLMIKFNYLDVDFHQLSYSLLKKFEPLNKNNECSEYIEFLNNLSKKITKERFKPKMIHFKFIYNKFLEKNDYISLLKIFNKIRFYKLTPTLEMYNLNIKISKFILNDEYTADHLLKERDQKYDVPSNDDLNVNDLVMENKEKVNKILKFL